MNQQAAQEKITIECTNRFNCNDLNNETVEYLECIQMLNAYKCLLSLTWIFDNDMDSTARSLFRYFQRLDSLKSQLQGNYDLSSDPQYAFLNDKIIYNTEAALIEKRKFLREKTEELIQRNIKELAL